MSTNIVSILQPMDQGITLTFKSHYLRNTFCESIDATERDYSDGFGQSKVKTF